MALVNVPDRTLDLVKHVRQTDRVDLVVNRQAIPAGKSRNGLLPSDLDASLLKT